MKQIEKIAAAKPFGIVLREKDLPVKEYSELARQVRDICRSADTSLIVHSHPAVARVRGIPALLMPLVSVMVNGARQMRAKELSNRLYDSAADDVAGLADWTFSGRRDDYLARLMEPDAQFNAVEARSARSLRRINAAGQIVFCALGICLLCWAALHFGNMAQAAAATGVPARPADLIAAFVLGFFPLLEAFEPLPGAALQAGAHLDSLERLNAIDEVEDDGDGSAAGN